MMWFRLLFIGVIALMVALTLNLRRAQTMTYVSPCDDSNYLQAAVETAPIPLRPADLIRTACLKPDMPADRIAGAILGQVETSTVVFSPIGSAIEAPTDALIEMFPETLDRDELDRSEVISNWEASRNTAVHIVRSPEGTMFLLIHDIL